jgi:hypothetical protein
MFKLPKKIAAKVCASFLDNMDESFTEQALTRNITDAQKFMIAYLSTIGIRGNVVFKGKYFSHIPNSIQDQVFVLGYKERLDSANNRIIESRA